MAPLLHMPLAVSRHISAMPLRQANNTPRRDILHCITYHWLGLLLKAGAATEETLRYAITTIEGITPKD